MHRNKVSKFWRKRDINYTPGLLCRILGNFVPFFGATFPWGSVRNVRKLHQGNTRHYCFWAPYNVNFDAPI